MQCAVSVILCETLVSFSTVTLRTEKVFAVSLLTVLVIIVGAPVGLRGMYTSVFAIRLQRPKRFVSWVPAPASVACFIVSQHQKLTSSADLGFSDCWCSRLRASP